MGILYPLQAQFLTLQVRKNISCISYWCLAQLQIRVLGLCAWGHVMVTQQHVAIQAKIIATCEGRFGRLQSYFHRIA